MYMYKYICMYVTLSHFRSKESTGIHKPCIPALLSRHSNRTVIDKQVCFKRQPVVDSVKSRRTIMDPVKPLGDINRVAWGPMARFHNE